MPPFFMRMNFNVVDSVKDVPTEWIYFNYLKVKSVMDGRPIRMKSFVNNDSTPSMFLYVKNGKYRWKDFSSGLTGSAIDVVMQQYKLSYASAAQKIVNDYNAFLKVHGKYVPLKIDTSLSDYALECDYSIREWNKSDQLYWWGKYYISTKLLEKYNIRPLRWYQLSKVYPDRAINYDVVSRDLMFGYFTSDGKLYQIYQPEYLDLKFIKLLPYIQGIDQLSQENDTLIIGASMKDILVIESVDIKVDTIAPPSETTFLSAGDINMFKQIYKYIFTLFDNDKPGIEAMKKYKALYGIDYIHIPFYKDLADFKFMLGWDKVRTELIININKKINI